METYERRRARLFVVTGFAVEAVGSLITLGRLISQGYFSLSTASSIELLLSDLAVLVSVWAWWWLTKVTVSSDDQRSFMSRAFFGLALASILFTAVALETLFQVPGYIQHGWDLAPLWAQGIGELAKCLGFVMMAREFTWTGALDVESGPEPVDADLAS